MALTSVAARMAASKHHQSAISVGNSAQARRLAEPRDPNTRTVEIAALRRDGSREIKSMQLPALPLFENAFSAFARGTLLQAPGGEVAIEDLQPGDHLLTENGEPTQVIWIGAASFLPRRPTGERFPLIRVMADAFGPARPESFVTFGGGARILQTPPHLRGRVGDIRLLTPVSAFVDNENVIEVSPPTPVTLFHIVLERHGVIRAGGLHCESFHPGTQALRVVPHSMRDLFLSMFPTMSHATDFGHLAHPRAPEPESPSVAAGR